MTAPGGAAECMGRHSKSGKSIFLHLQSILYFYSIYSVSITLIFPGNLLVAMSRGRGDPGSAHFKPALYPAPSPVCQRQLLENGAARSGTRSHRRLGKGDAHRRPSCVRCTRLQHRTRVPVCSTAAEPCWLWRGRKHR